MCKSNIDIIKIERGDDLKAIVLSKNTGKRLAEIHNYGGYGYYFEEKEPITWMLSELEEIINYCKKDVYSPDKIAGKIFAKNMEAKENEN